MKHRYARLALLLRDPGLTDEQRDDACAQLCALWLDMAAADRTRVAGMSLAELRECARVKGD